MLAARLAGTKPAMVAAMARLRLAAFVKCIGMREFCKAD